MNLDENLMNQSLFQPHESTVLILTGGEDVGNHDETVCYFMDGKS